MERWQELEIEYAKKLRASARGERRMLYEEAYRVVSQTAMLDMSREPEKRTAGTSPALVKLLSRLCGVTDHVLEVGCGRGYTCLKLAPHVSSIVGIDVSAPALNEARQLLETNQVNNVTVLEGFADELIEHFGKERFDKVISIDVHEHLAPEDAKAHLHEVYAVLKRNGRFIVITPNRLTGPHDLTRQVFPGTKEALGFHLNETTCSELVQLLKEVGFVRFRSVLPLSFKLSVPFDMIYPSGLFIAVETLFPKIREHWLIGRFARLLSGIILIADKR